MAVKVHDICNTSKMASVYNPAMIHVTGRAGADLDNGRIAVLNPVTEIVSYPTDATAKKIYLIKSGEKLYDGVRESLTDFYNKDGVLVRIFQIVEDDEFETTAIPAVVAVGDTLQTSATGEFVTYVAGAWKFTVVEVGYIGLFKSAMLKAELV